MPSLRKRGRCWYYRYVDADGVKHERKGCPDRRETESMAAAAESDAAKVKSGLIDPKALGFREQERKPLAAHLADYRAYLIGKGTTANHSALTANRVARLIDLADARRVSDLVPSSVQAALKAVRDKGARRETGVSLRSVHHYTRAVKGFSRWQWRDGRAREDALAHLTPPNPDPDRRRVRRALSADEQTRLVRAAESGPIIFGRPGADRAVLYALALGTGFRANELRSLVPTCFDLDGDPPTVTVRAAYSKRRRDDAQPIRPELAAALRPWLAAKATGATVFGPLTMRTGEMIRADLERADIPYETSQGTADFHALRHSYVSSLARGTASVKAVQTLARHSTPALTFGVYAHIGLYDQTAALDALPDLSAPTPGTEATALAATGTDGPTHKPTFAHPLPTDGDGSGRKLSVVGGNEHTSPGRAGRAEPLGGGGLVASCRPPSDTVRNYTRRDLNPQPTVPKTVALSN